MRRLSTPLAVVLIAVVLAGATLVVRDLFPAGERTPGSCRALGAPVAGLEAIRWSNGVTRSAATWGQVLDVGVTEAATEQRAEIAASVAADDGFGAVLAAVPDRLVPAARRLRADLLDVERSRSTAQPSAVERDVVALRRLTGDECGWA